MRQRFADPGRRSPAPVLVEAEYFRSRTPQREHDADDSSRRGSGNQIEVRSDRTVEVLLRLPQECCRKRAGDAAPVDAREPALFLPRLFDFPCKRRLPLSATVGVAPTLATAPVTRRGPGRTDGSATILRSPLRSGLHRTDAPSVRSVLRHPVAGPAPGCSVLRSFCPSRVPPAVSIPTPHACVSSRLALEFDIPSVSRIY